MARCAAAHPAGRGEHQLKMERWRRSGPGATGYARMWPPTPAGHSRPSSVRTDDAPDGRPDAGARWTRGDAPHPSPLAGHERPTDRGDDGERHGRRSRAPCLAAGMGSYISQADPRRQELVAAIERCRRRPEAGGRGGPGVADGPAVPLAGGPVQRPLADMPRPPRPRGGARRTRSSSGRSTKGLAATMGGPFVAELIDTFVDGRPGPRWPRSAGAATER